MYSLASFIAVVAAWLSTVTALSPAGWRQQSIYQVVTDRFALSSGGTTPSCSGSSQLNLYCNGTFAGLIEKLDYIQDMGFTAIWISPVVENIAGGSPDGYTPDGSAYHGYWAQDIYQINSHFGGSSGLSALSTALHKRGMYLMVDVVVNHMGYFCGIAKDGSCGPGNSVDYSIYNPFNSQSYFHPFCEINYNNKTSILDCWEGDEIVPLPDLRTENSNVQSMFDSWITGLVKNYSIDGLRIDSLQQSGSFFFPSFWDAAGQLYMVGEVFNGNPSYVCPYQQSGMPGVLNYPMFYYITQAFENNTGSMSNLVNGIASMQKDCTDTTLLGSFLENQDNARFASHTEDLALAMNAITFTILQDGVPITYYGQEQHLNGASVPLNREALWTSGGYNTGSSLYQLITKVNAIRTRAISVNSNFTTYKIQTPYHDTNTIVTRKGNTGAQIVGVYSNLGSSGASSSLTLTSAQTGFSANEKVMEVLSCTVLTTDGSGNIIVPRSAGQPKILFPSAALSGSSICSNAGKSSTSTKVAQSTTMSTSHTTSAPSATCTSAPVTFDVKVATTYGESVVVTGNVSALGNWSPASGLALGAQDYTTADPLWYGTTTGIAPQTAFEWKAVVVSTSGGYTWSPGSNLQGQTGCTGETESYTWSS